MWGFVKERCETITAIVPRILYQFRTRKQYIRLADRQIIGPVVCPGADLTVHHPPPHPRLIQAAATPGRSCDGGWWRQFHPTSSLLHLAVTSPLKLVGTQQSSHQISVIGHPTQTCKCPKYETLVFPSSS